MPDAANTTQLNPHPAQARPDRRCAQAATQGVTTSSYGLGRDFNAPIAFPEAVLTLRAVSPAVWDALLPDVLVAERQAELAVARLLAGAREAAEADGAGRTDLRAPARGAGRTPPRVGCPTRRVIWLF